ncbi:MAG: Gfo/Idh/MocA family oxidoreductase [Pseudomonadota bacterium]
MKKIGWALVGASTVAREWMIGAIRAQDNAEIVAVVSRDAQRGAQFAQEFGIGASFTELDAALAHPGVDAVYISTTNEVHMAQTVAAARAGKHVLCEKPLALNLDDARAMLAACEQAGVVLGINHHLRNAATHRKMRDMLREGAIGKPLYCRVLHANFLPQHLRGWRLDSPQAGGVTLDMFVHDADTLRFVLDAEPQHVIACASSGDMAVAGLEDGLMATIQFDNGVLAQVHDAFNARYSLAGLEIIGTEGTIFARDVMTQRPVGTIQLTNADGVADVPVAHENLYVRSVGAFQAAVRGEGRPAATGEDGLRALAAALAVQQSCRTGMRVAVAA